MASATGKEAHKNDPPSHEERRSRGGHHDTEDSSRFTWTAPNMEPHVEPPRPEGWKPLVIVPELVQLSDEAERKLADDRMKEWSKDQEEYADRKFREIEEKKAALKSQAEKDAREKAEIERQAQEREKQEKIARRTRRKAEMAEARENEDTEEVGKIKAKYRECFGQTLEELREIERELEEIQKARRAPGILWGETSKLILRKNELGRRENKLLGERESLNLQMDEEMEEKLAALRQKWKQEDETQGGDL
jgi:hypothetical protein